LRGGTEKWDRKKQVKVSPRQKVHVPGFLGGSGPKERRGERGKKRRVGGKKKTKTSLKVGGRPKETKGVDKRGGEKGRVGAQLLFFGEILGEGVHEGRETVSDPGDGKGPIWDGKDGGDKRRSREEGLKRGVIGREG